MSGGQRVTGCRVAGAVGGPVRPRGLSLIELLVSMVIGLVVVLAVTGVMVRSEGAKRSTTTLNDLNQTGAYLSYAIDRLVRSAGSGFAQRWADAFGCNINASRGNSTLLPRSSVLPAPFTAVSTSQRLAPLLIGKSQSDGGSDVLAVMAGTAGFGESPPRVLPASVTSNSLRLPNTLNARGDDLLLLAEDGVGCMVQQVTSGFVGSDDQALPLSGTYYGDTGSTVNLAQFGVSNGSYAMALGNAADNPPQFQLIGVGANATLFSYDLLRIDGSDAAVPISDGVVALRALYGIDGDGDGKLDGWADPGTSPYRPSDLLDGSAAARTRLRRIVAVRIALVLRTPLVEKPAASGYAGYTTLTPARLTLFGSLDPAVWQIWPVTGDDRYRRFRVVEFTVPLRNILLLP